VIVNFEEFNSLRNTMCRIICASGGFDPIHPGHVDYLNRAKELGNTLVVVVNGDNFLRVKKGKPFQDLFTRCYIVDNLRSVDYVIPFEIENDQTVCVALEKIRPHIFVKGGDRTSANVPECGVCAKLNIDIVYNIGMEKIYSSSHFLDEWTQHVRGY
jgi:rfaE bifunctional protein nucleotidyltransferase chain/domain